MSCPFMTNSAGAPVDGRLQNTGDQMPGPITLQDTWFLEKLAHFDREVIPERRMHAKGSGAFGEFTVTSDAIQKFSKAKLFDQVGKKTPVFARFSTVAGERGAADAERDIRGFAVKFYTEEGNWDVVGNNTPVFFLRNPRQFPDLNRAVKRNPRTNMRDGNANWDFWTQLPEALHQITITMSDRGLPKSYRHMNGYGSHTFSLISPENERFFVKFHFKAQQDPSVFTSDEEAEKIVGKDRESFQRDLYESIEQGVFPKWKLCVQVMPEKEALDYHINPFDLTKVWPHGDYPLIEVGLLELNKNPDNYFAQVEQAAFSPANVVPGISFSPDPMLQGRLFSYGDAARYRLGVNHDLIPVNRPRCPYAMYHRDGTMRVDDNGGSMPTYHPNSNGLLKTSPVAEEPPQLITSAANHWHKSDADHFSQPGNLFRKMSPDQQQRLFTNTARALDGVRPDIIERHIQHCMKADPAYGQGVQKALQNNKTQREQ